MYRQYQSPHLFFEVVSKLRVVLELRGYKVQGKDGGKGLHYSEQILLSPCAAADTQCFRGILSLGLRSVLICTIFIPILQVRHREGKRLMQG